MIQTLRKADLIVILVLAGLLSGCREVTVPRPRGYFRIDLPEKVYQAYNDSFPGLPLKFEYPAYGKLSPISAGISEPGWFNIDFPDYKATIYLTYKNIHNDLEGLMEQTYRMNVKNHIAKADAINEQVIEDTARRLHGILYDLKGNSATAVQFFVTDSTDHFLRGSLYFKAAPNPDSLAPVIDFFREDIVHLIGTLNWK